MPFRVLLALAAGLTTAACHQQARESARSNSRDAVPYAPAPQPSPSGAPTPTITLSGVTTLTVTPATTPCGAEKLPNYANLLPTSTAKDEISRTLGHRNVRYVPENTPLDPTRSNRLSALLGADGRIKKFACG